VRIVRRLAAACAVLALLLACVAADSQGALSGDDGDDVAVCCDLSAVLPAAHGELSLTLSPCGAVFVDDLPPSGRAPELDIFRPPEPRA
jgi:hypothetical protein